MRVVVRLAGERGCRDVVVDVPRDLSVHLHNVFLYALAFTAEYLAKKGERVVRVSEVGYH